MQESVARIVDGIREAIVENRLVPVFFDIRVRFHFLCHRQPNSWSFSNMCPLDSWRARPQSHRGIAVSIGSEVVVQAKCHRR